MLIEARRALAADEAVRVRTVLVDTRAVRAGRRRADRTTWSLVAGSVVVLLVLVGAGRVIGSALAERQALIDASRFTQLVAGTFVDKPTAQRLLEGDESARARMDEIVRDRLEVNTSVRRVKVWTAQGVVVYSDEPTEIGKRYVLEGDKRTSLRSDRAAAAVTHLTDGEDAQERILGDRLLEVYTSIETTSGEPLLFELYFSYDNVRKQREAVFETLTRLAIIALVALTGVQLVLGLGHLRWLRRRHRAITEDARAGRERDRQLLARNLHDGVIQELVGAAFLMDGALSAMDGGDGGDVGDVGDVRTLVTGATGSVRDSVQGLRSVLVDLYPRPIHQGGLPDALHELAQPLRARAVEVSVDAAELPLDQENERELAEVVHRCAQELIRNVVRHAEAMAVDIRVELATDWVTLTVRDDGRGMTPDQMTAAGDHLGLRALADIVTERRGVLEITSAPGQGTEVKMRLRR